MADRVVFMDVGRFVEEVGRIVEENEPEASFKDPRHGRTRLFLGQIAMGA